MSEKGTIVNGISVIKFTDCEYCNESCGGICDQTTLYGGSKQCALCADITNCFIKNLYVQTIKAATQLAPFQDEYFKGLDTKAIAELAKKSQRLTSENRELEQKNEELKAQIENEKQALQIDIDNLNKACLDLSQENEELKHQIEDVDTLCSEKESLIDKYLQTIEQVKKFVAGLMFDVDCTNWFERFVVAFENWKSELGNDRDKYKKALDEIEYYINNQGFNNNWNMRIQRFRMGILDIINKAKDCE